MIIDSHDVHLKWMQDPEYAEEFQDAQARLELACQMAQARARSGLNQEQLAQAVGTTQTQVSRWERGKASPTGDSLRRFAEVTSTRLFFVPEEFVPQVARLIGKSAKRKVHPDTLKRAAGEAAAERRSARTGSTKRKKLQPAPAVSL